MRFTVMVAPTSDADAAVLRQGMSQHFRQQLLGMARGRGGVR